MSSPFEDLEYLADFLPDEGETVLVSRRDGELVCELFGHDEDMLLEGFSDPVFYGRLVHANERLVARGTLPIWACGLSWFWGCVVMHRLSGLGWTGWFLDVGLMLVAAAVCFVWIRRRQQELYRTEIKPVLHRQIAERGYDRFAVLGAMRHHPELRTLLDATTRASG